MLFRSFAVMCLFALALEAKMQNVTVKGTTICHNTTVGVVLVQLFERNIWHDHDLLNQIYSNSHGEFIISGSKNESGSITPYIRITHSCDAKPNCERIAEHDVPKDKIGSIYDMTYIPMNIMVQGEKEDCS